MKKIAFLFGVVMVFAGSAQGQANIKEEVYMHLSSNDLIVGETIRFSGFVFSEYDGQLSKLSRILYVELINERGHRVFKSKIEIKDGRGSGEYFIPVEIETGNYHFVAYTKWMRNFNDFFHEPIVIINPYKPFNLKSKSDKQLNLEFFPEGGELLVDAKNHIVIRAFDQQEEGVQVKGKIVNGSGTVLTDFLTDQNGFYGFDFTPLASESYQVILENETGFDFYDLPSACNTCSRLNVKRKEDVFLASVKSNGYDEFAVAKLEIHKGQSLVYDESITLNNSVLIQKSNLPIGLLKMAVSIDGVISNERLLWNGDVVQTKINDLGIYPSLKELKTSFELEEASSFSISIERVSSQNTSLGIDLAYQIDSKIDRKLSPQFYSSMTHERLDDLLIASKLTSPSVDESVVEFPPEYRSGLVQGQVLNDKEMPMADLKMGLSFVGAKYLESASYTNDSGQFLLSYQPNLVNGVAYVNVVGGDSLIDYNIEVKHDFYESYPAFNNRPIKFDSTRVVEIVNRSIENQIENAYYSVSSNINEASGQSVIDGYQSYRLDEFTRFSTIRDTFIEYIPEVGVSKNETKYRFNMRTIDLTYGEKVDGETLLLLDGVFAKAEDIFNLSPYQIERIDVLNRKYYFGKVVFDGVIAFQSFKGDRAGVASLGTRIEMAEFQNQVREPLSVNIPSPKNKEPQYQDLIYWNPEIKHEGGVFDLSFFTSEVKGLFEIRIEGITESGQPVSRKSYFQVK